jgi:hypothetical protein
MLALLLLLLAGAAGIRGVVDVAAWQAANAVCDAAARGSPLPEGPAPSHLAARDATRCACDADIARRDPATCANRVEHLLAEPAHADWIPPPPLTALVLGELVRAGRTGSARPLARRAVGAPPIPDDVAELALQVLLTEGDDPAPVLAAARATPPGSLLRILVIETFGRARKNPPADLLDGAAPVDATLRQRWHVGRAELAAHRGDADAVDDEYDAWVKAGEDPGYVMAFRISTLQGEALRPPRGAALDDAFESALAAMLARNDRDNARYLFRRYLGTLANSGLAERAVEVFRRAEALGLAPASVNEEILRRSARVASAPGDDDTNAAETSNYVFDLGAAPPGSTAWIGDALAVDAPYRAVRPGEVVAGVAPLRYVVRTPEGIVASGRAWPRGDATTVVHVRPGPASTVSPPPPLPTPRPGNGTRRLFTVLLDCGDWRIARHLMERGELPVLQALAERGERAVLRSQPAYTGEALESIVHPSTSRRISVPDTIFKMGNELAGLSFIGTNPWKGLEEILPQRPNFFRVIGDGPRSAVNLLFTLGGQAADPSSRNGDVSGPHGARTERALGTLQRPLTDAELERFPRLRGEELLHPIAAEFDLLDEEARRGSIDVVVMRIEALDLLTHRHFIQFFDENISDEESIINSSYRYVDHRLGGVVGALDADDFLVVMSDHGIATGLKHDERAVWILNGPGIAPRRIPGMPNLRGVPRRLAELIDVTTDWPDGGFGPAALPK